MTKDAIKEAATRLGCWSTPYARLPKSEAHNRALVALVQEAEREACASLFQQPHVECCGWEIQEAIRARGQL